MTLFLLSSITKKGPFSFRRQNYDRPSYERGCAKISAGNLHIPGRPRKTTELFFHPSTLQIHSVLVVEGGKAHWLYGGDLDAEAVEFFLAALNEWCKPSEPGCSSICNAILKPESPYDAVIFKPDPITGYVADRYDDLRQNATAFGVVMEFLFSLNHN